MGTHYINQSNQKNKLNWSSLMLSMVIVIPFWLTIGRGLLGSSGWITVFSFLGPIEALIIILLIFYSALKKDYETKIANQIRNIGRWLITALYISLFSLGFFVIDNGDVGRGYSVATRVFGDKDNIYNLSNTLSDLSYPVSGILILVIMSICIILFFLSLRFKTIRKFQNK